TFRLCVVHCLPSAIRLEEYIVLDACWSCAEGRSKEALTDPNAILSAIDTTYTRIGLVLSLTLVINDLDRVPIAKQTVNWHLKPPNYFDHIKYAVFSTALS